ncbi:MAG: type IV pilus twitching motility protein PilT [Planctomycetes bacterium]|jgi:twitching motility protein PilT|nr:type IV pilus twitching motility protein PilT [Planctomycetota bacterium]
MITMEELLALLIRQGGSDLHITVASPPRIRVDGVLLPVECPALSPDDTRRLATSVLTSDQIAKLDRELELDCSFGLSDQGRFRANIFHQQGAVAAVMRLIPTKIATFEQLGLPRQVCERICSLRSGLVLVTGSTGSGKSTSLASMINHINQTHQGHIVTIEDPVEFTHVHKQCLITQREVGGDTQSFNKALKSVLRQDPDVVLIGEMRDFETIEAALTLAETGHLTFGTLHTSDAVQTINRIVDVFPSHQQQQVRTQLAFTLEAVVSQQLLPMASGRGRAMAAEMLICNPAVRALVRENKAHQIYSQIQTGQRLGMRTMAASLADLVRSGKVRMDDADRAVSDPAELRNLLRAA